MRLIIIQTVQMFLPFKFSDPMSGNPSSEVLPSGSAVMANSGDASPAPPPHPPIRLVYLEDTWKMVCLLEDQGHKRSHHHQA